MREVRRRVLLQILTLKLLAPQILAIDRATRLLCKCLHSLELFSDFGVSSRLCARLVPLTGGGDVPIAQPSGVAERVKCELLYEGLLLAMIGVSLLT